MVNQKKDVGPTETTWIAASDSSCNIDSYTCPSTTICKPVDTTVSIELIYILKNSLPVLVTFLFQYIIQIMISIYFASKLGPEYLAACSLSITTFYLSGPVIFNGFSTALDTLCSTAFGAGHYRKVGLYYQRCTVILLFALLPISVFWLNAGPVLAAMTSEKKLVTLCEQYLRLMPLAAPAVVIFECSKRYLQSQYKFTVPTRITILALPLSFILNTKFLPIFKFQGPPLAFIITYWFMCISLLLYIFFIDGYQCWRPNTTIRQLFSDWAPFFRLGIPGVLMIMSEAFAFQILTILSTRFGLDELAAQSVVSTLASFAFQLPFSVGICCSTRIANIIGGRSSNHKVAIPVTIGVACFLSFFNFAWMVAFRYPLAKQFSDDNELISKVCHLFLVVGFNQFLDCINILCAAILRGQGRQRIGSSLSLFSYYIIATPFELLLGFYYDMKVFGLWLGLALGVSFLSISELIVVLRSDWDSIMRKSAEIV